VELIKNPNLNFMGSRRIAYVISIIVLAIGLISLLVQGLNYGVDLPEELFSNLSLTKK